MQRRGSHALCSGRWGHPEQCGLRPGGPGEPSLLWGGGLSRAASPMPDPPLTGWPSKDLARGAVFIWALVTGVRFSTGKGVLAF